MKPKHPRDRLRAFLDDPTHPERSRTWLAGILGISQAAVSQWVAAKEPTRPDDTNAAALERLAGIPADDWLNDVERAKKRRREAALRALAKKPAPEAA